MSPQGRAVLLLVLAACTPKRPKAGDVCTIEDENRMICSDPATALRCSAGKLEALPCAGPNGCAVAEHQRVDCDRRFDREGEACLLEGAKGDYLCSLDQQTLLRCEQGRFARHLECRGPMGSHAAKPHHGYDLLAGCDRSVGAAGDACNVRRERSETLGGTCSVDGKQQLVCDKDEDGRLVTSRLCSGGCTIGGSDSSFPMPVCNPGGLSPGARCARNDTVECSHDSGAVLTCDPARGQYATTTTFPPKTRCSYPGRGAPPVCRAL